MRYLKTTFDFFGLHILILTSPAFATIKAKRRYLVSLFAITAVIIGSLLNFEEWFPDYLIGDITNTLHFPSGVLLALIVGRRVRRSRVAAWAVWVGALALFALIEIVQPFFDRSCSFSDWAQSSLGMTLGMCFTQITSQSSVYARRLLKGLAGVLAIVFSIPLLHKLQTVDTHASQFPVLFLFEDNSDLLLWKGYGGSSLARMTHEQSPANEPHNNRYFARVRYGDSDYPAIAYVAVQRDWRGYRHFCFDSRGDRPGQILRFKLRDIRAKGQDVDLRWQFDNPPHWHRICVSLEGLRRKTGEPFDLSSVYSLHMIGAKHSEERWFDIDNVRLER